MRSGLNTGNVIIGSYTRIELSAILALAFGYRRLYGIFQFSGLKAQCECYISVREWNVVENNLATMLTKQN